MVIREFVVTCVFEFLHLSSNGIVSQRVLFLKQCVFFHVMIIFVL